VDLIVHPMAEEQLFLTGQSHPGVRVRHRCSQSRVDACRAA
jgi:hypothetical protein